VPDDGGWKETFKFFIQELKDFWDLVLPVPPLQGEPEEGVGEKPQPIPAPQPPSPPLPEIPEGGLMQPVFPMQQVAGEPSWVPPYDPPDMGPRSPSRTPFPPWAPMLPYGYDAGTPTPPKPYSFSFPPLPVPLWEDWQDWHIVQTYPPDLERKA